ncbi:acetyl-CoA carboxylase biotin carboxyl carrier protein [Flavisolibacter sp. BT320]|nr:acetyl-CoA carboxylase biotin carboxyl carrier protein [Flavisolibacter longurius]
MDFKQIQELIKMINKSNIGEVSIEQKDFRITIKQKEDNITQLVSAPASMSMPQAVQQAAPYQAPASAQVSTPQADASAASSSAGSANLVTIKSPMIGTFYRRPSPDKPNFVEVGSEVSSGDVVCIIEAMKLFNEIESEVKGKIVKILAEDSTPVEYDQPLFLVDPS